MKLNTLNERFNPEPISGSARKSAFQKHLRTAKNTGSGREEAWLMSQPQKRHKGKRSEVQFKLDPAQIIIDRELSDYLAHTHPPGDEETTIFNAMPSVQDIRTTISNINLGIPGSVIYCDPYWVAITPTKKLHKRSINISNHKVMNYNSALGQMDLDGAKRALEDMGFEVDHS